jgi:hypothetical protein
VAEINNLADKYDPKACKHHPLPSSLSSFGYLNYNGTYVVCFLDMICYDDMFLEFCEGLETIDGQILYQHIATYQ